MTKDEFNSMVVHRGKKVLVRVCAEKEISAVDFENGLVECTDGKQYHFHDLEEKTA
jgi:hypothetical protein